MAIFPRRAMAPGSLEETLRVTLRVDAMSPADASLGGTTCVDAMSPADAALALDEEVPSSLHGRGGASLRTRLRGSSRRSNIALGNSFTPTRAGKHVHSRRSTRQGEVFALGDDPCSP